MSDLKDRIETIYEEMLRRWWNKIVYLLMSSELQMRQVKKYIMLMFTI